MTWAFDTAKSSASIACIVMVMTARAHRHQARMTEVGSGPPGTTVYIKDRGKRKRVSKQGDLLRLRDT